MRLTLSAASALLLCLTATAQAPSTLIGVTANAPQLRQLDLNCNPVMQCGLAAFPGAPAGVLPAGGTGYSGRLGGAWVSNGDTIACVQAETCAYICFPTPLPNLAVGEYVSGLAVDESRGELWVLTSIGDIARYTDACPPVLIGRCNLGVIVGPNRAPAGLALDEANNLVFVAYSNWNTGQSDILVSRQATPCQTIQTLRALCFTGVPAPITGLAMDSCNDRLVLTSGLQVIEMTLIIVPGPTGPLARLVPGPCCTIPGADPLIGLAVRPGVATSSGVGCSNGSCLPCANEHVLRNDPMVGNPAFQLRLRNVPEGSLAYLAVSPGPCAPTPPFGPLCGPVGVNPALSTILGFELTGGTVGCAGSANFNIPIPNDPALCGRVFSSQGFVLCPAGAGGLAQTNCLSWEIRGS